MKRCSVLTFGTVLGEDEDPGSERVMAAAGHAAAVIYHAMHLRGGATALPGGDRWVAALEEIPDASPHLALHEGHLIEANERDRLVISGATLTAFGLARPVRCVARPSRPAGAAGATEIAYQPAGPDIEGELHRFMDMANG